MIQPQFDNAVGGVITPHIRDEISALLKSVVDAGMAFKLRDAIYEIRMSPHDIRDAILQALPAEGTELSTLLKEAESLLLPLCKNEASPYFCGFGDTGADTAAIAGGILDLFCQQNLINQSFDAPVATFVEIAVLRWLRDLVGYTSPSEVSVRSVWDVGGIVTTGGTMSNTVRAVTADIPTSVQRLHADGMTGAVDVIGAFWSLSYPLSDYLEHLDEHSATPAGDVGTAAGQALVFIHDLVSLLAPSGRMLALFFDSDSPEQQLVTRLWDTLGPCPGGRGYTRNLLLQGLRERAEHDGGVLTVSHHRGVATARDKATAMAWFIAVHCKNHPVIMANPGTMPAIEEFVTEHTEPDGRVSIPSGAYLINYQAGDR